MPPPRSTVARAKPVPRGPSRDRGVQRFGALLDATERLLSTSSPDDIGLYQIAEEAGIPPASVYHFFPTKDAAFFALAERYFEDFLRSANTPIDAAALRSWQDLIQLWIARITRLYNDHPPAMKIFYGGYASLSVRQADMRFNQTIADHMYDRLDGIFHMPHVRDPAKRFEIALSIMDATLALSYFHHGRITDDYAAEALNAFTAYCRLFLPERAEPRERLREAAARNEQIVLPPVNERQPVTTG